MTVSRRDLRSRSTGLPYAYDENGNRTDDVTNVNGTHDYTTGANNRLLSDGVYDYEYDHEGNRTRKTEIATGDYVAYGWDHRNRLVSVTTYDAKGTPSNFTDDVVVHNVTYAYDADNRLIRHFVDPAGDEGSEPAEQTIFIYRGGQVEMQFEGPGGEGNISLFDLYHRFLWGPGVDMLLADEQIVLNDEQTDFEGTTYWTLGDHLGSIRDVVDVNGNLRLHRAYDAFGNVVDEVHYNASGVEINEGSAGYVDVQFSYTGKFFDVATGLQNNWNRWYDPRTGKWTSEDPIGFDGGDANLSRYVGNRSVSNTDSNGLEPDDRSWWQRLTGSKPRPGGAMIGGQGGRREQSQISKDIMGDQKSTQDFMGGKSDGTRAHCPEQLAKDLAEGSEQLIEFMKDSSAHIQTVQWINGHELFMEDREYTDEDFWSWNLKQGITIGGPVVVGGVIHHAGKLKKAINLPSWRKIDIDVAHIASGHLKGGFRVQASQSRKTLFPESWDCKQLEIHVRDAYRYSKKIATQGERVQLQGSSGGVDMIIWLNVRTKQIETAWPIEIIK